MKLSYNWLKDYLDIKVKYEELAGLLTAHGFKVEEIRELKDLDDRLLEIEVTSNRPDCLSVIGLAREVSAITRAKLRLPRADNLKNVTELKAKDFFKVRIDDACGCKQYTARLISGVKVAESPSWLKNRISAAGLRPINNIVDITNFVLLEYGQPLHAFDYKKIQGKEIRVRLAEKGEKLTTIDGVVLTLSSEDLVIADSSRPIALAGIMGGKDTEVSNETTDVLLESACFYPLLIRKSSGKFGLTTESSYRFEREIDLTGVELASDRAASLFMEVAGAKGMTNIVVTSKRKTVGRKVTLRHERVNQTLGVSLSANQCAEIIESLFFSVKKSKAGLDVQVPSWRSDVRQEIDLIEEVARIYGYEKIPSTLPQIQLSALPENREYRIVRSMRQYLKAAGLAEVITYTLMGRKALSEKLGYNRDGIVRIKNPLSMDQEVMRPLLLPSLLDVIAGNVNQRVTDVKIFEIGKVYADHSTCPQERLTLGIALTGKRQNNWKIKGMETDFYDLKGVLSGLCRETSVPFGTEAELTAIETALPFLKLAPPGPDFLDPSCSLNIALSGRIVGYMGRVHPAALERFGIRQDVYAAELSIEEILTVANTESHFKKLPRFPSITRDLSIIVKEAILSSRITSLIRETGGGLVQEILLFDRYSGKQVPQGHMGLSYSIEYQDRERTLTDEEVNQVQNRIREALSSRLGAVLR